MHRDAQAGNRAVGLREFGQDIKRRELAAANDPDAVVAHDLKHRSVRRRNFHHLHRQHLKIAAALCEPRSLARFPGAEHRGIGLRELGFERRDARAQRGLVVGFQHGAGADKRPRIHPAVAVEPFVAERIEECERAEIILLRDRVELVVVALGAGEREPEHGFAESFDAVGVIVGEVLLGNRAALVGDHVVALKSGRDLVGLGAIRKQITGKLRREKAIVGQIVVERLDHPIAPEPEVPAAVDGESVGVGVARGVEPIERQPLAEVRAREQAVNEPLDGVRRAIGGEGLDLRDRGREPREIERQPTNQRAAIRLGRGPKLLRDELRLHKRVHRVLDFRC